MQVEQFEADLEALAPAKPKGGRTSRAVELERCMARHKEHIARLEQVLRLLENDQARRGGGGWGRRAAGELVGGTGGRAGAACVHVGAQRACRPVRGWCR